MIILVGGTGALGFKIASYLAGRGASVKALVRKEVRIEKVNALENLGIKVERVDFNDPTTLREVCVGGDCVVSAVSGLEDVIVKLQTRLVKAASAAGVPRFIPSDYCIDYTRLSRGSNRNLDLRREFQHIVDKEPIAVTSIFNGMFTELLKGQAPVILKSIKKIMYWGSADQLMDFTTMEDTAQFTAEAALDPNTPRFLKIAGEVSNIKGIQNTASQVYGRKFGLLRLGGLGVLDAMIKITRTLKPSSDEVFPPWQGMQYLHNMLSGLPKLDRLDNHRYPQLTWTSIRDVLLGS